jgi:hypothetical protein
LANDRSFSKGNLLSLRRAICGGGCFIPFRTNKGFFNGPDELL